MVLSPADWQAIVATFVFFSCLPISIVCAGYVWRITRRLLEPSALVMAGVTPAMFSYQYCQVVIGCYPQAQSSASLRPSLLVLSLAMMSFLIVFTRLSVSLDRRVVTAMIDKEALLEQEKRVAILTRQMELAEEYRKYKSEIATNVSHELRTSVNIILGFSEPELAAMAHMPSIHRSAKRMRDLINNMSAMLRLESDRVVVRSDVDLAVIALESIEETAAFVDKIRVRSDLEPATVYGSHHALVVVVCDILHNAIKFTPFPGEVLVQTYRVDGGGVVVITDSGIGIGDEHLLHIFEPFYQADSSTIRPYPGVGLGLYVASEIVRKHDGWISVDSELGTGSVFTVFIPGVSQDG